MMAKDLPKTVDGAPRAFFGRRSGKTLHQGQRALIDDLLPQLEIANGEAPVVPAELFPGATSHVLEIGYGGGEHLARIARENPQDGFIGCEVFTGGIGKLLETIDAEAIENIALFPDDVIKLLAVLPAAALDCIYVLYPDPWPKSRHHKRRLIQFPVLAEFARVLRPGGTFRFATDIEDYANWTLSHIVRSQDFAWPIVEPGAWHTPYRGWQATRYEAKARRQGREKSFYFEFLRTS